MTMNLSAFVRDRFCNAFGEEPLVVRSPGRVNLIGEHTDYNMGFVLPAAIEKAVYFAVTPRADRSCRIIALDMNDEHTFTLDDLRKSPKGWPNYPVGVVEQFIKAGYRIRGFQCVFGGDIPIGAGLSSSAAIEAGLAYALDTMFGLKIDPLALVRMAQKAENEFVGVKCGIMDQYVNIFGREGSVLKIDCRSLEHVYYPFHFDVAVVLFDTRVSHSLASSEYNRRREECADGVTLLRARFPGVMSLRDVTPDMLAEARPAMPQTVYRRCRYVVDENARVGKACQALEENALGTFGGYMNETHVGLRDEYEVSCPELDYLVDLVRDHPQVFGARMMGGGFGGCTINLVGNDALAQLCATVGEKFEDRFGIAPIAYVTSIGAGTGVVPESEYARV